MTRVLFCHGADDRLQAAVAWLWQSGAGKPGSPAVVIYLPDARQAERLDQWLWSQPPTGFLPHCPADAPLADETPILIADDLDRLGADRPHQILLNLADDMPDAFSRYDQLVEIVSHEDAVRLPARQRARFYRDRGYELQYRDLQKDPL